METFIEKIHVQIDFGAEFTCENHIGRLRNQLYEALRNSIIKVIYPRSEKLNTCFKPNHVLSY